MHTIMCGFSQNIITPFGEGIFMDGYGHRMSPASGVHDDLYVKTAVFGTDADDLFAIIVMDILGVNTEIYTLLTDYIYTLTGLDKSQVAICGIHTHSGPASGILAGLPINYDYWCHTAEICSLCILEAIQNMRECTCQTAIADKELLASVNRRNRPFIDRRIKTAVFKDMDGHMIGVISTACCHPVVNTSLELSADYPQILTQRAIEEYHIPFLFLLGTAADINPHPDIMAEPVHGIEILGNELTDGIFNAVRKADIPWKPTFIQHAYKYAEIPMKPFPSLDTIEKNMKESMKTYHGIPWSVKKHYALRELEWHRHIHHKALQGETSELYVPLQIFSIDRQLVFLFLPFEAMTNTGKRIEEFFQSLGYGAENIFVISCANSVNGYLAPPEEFPYGGYEITDAAYWYGLPKCSEHSEPAVIHAIKDLALESGF